MKRSPPPPLRFLLLVTGGWLLIRTAAYAPGWFVDESVAAPVAERPIAVAQAPAVEEALGAEPPTERVASHRLPVELRAERARASRGSEMATVRTPPAPTTTLPASYARIASATSAVAALPTVQPTLTPTRPSRQGAGRWSGSAWLLVRRDGGAALASAGTLGGSQSGLRIGYRINGDASRPLAISARLYAPLRDRRGAEAALGLDWQPLGALPVHLLAERRQALGRRGRSAFALSAYGGLSARPLPAGLRLDAYGQAGMVGARSRDLFADGAARISLPVGRVDIGAGLWGGAQPGAARLDAGPALSLRLPETRLRVSAEWRFRVAGDAQPGSGPALTIGSDF